MRILTPALALFVAWSRVSGAFVAGPIQNVSNDAADSLQPKIAQGPDGNAHLVWVSGNASREVRYAKGTWTGSNYAFGASHPLANVGSYGFATPNIAVSSNNVAAVCWSDGTTLWVRTWPATNSAPGGSANGIGSGINASIATDRSNRFHIAWSGNFDVHYCLWNGTACERSDSFGLANGLRPDIAVDTNDNVHVVWDGNGVWYRNRAAGGNWNANVQLDTGGNLCQIASDGLGEVHIAWSRDFDIQYRRRTFSNPSLETRTFDSGSDLEPSIGATPSGRVLIGFRDATPNKLRYMVRENGTWTAIRDFMDGVQLDISARGYFERLIAASSHNWDIQLLSVNGEFSSEVLVPQGSIWKFRDTGSDQGTAWRGTNFNDASWTNGFAQLGFGDGDEAAVVNGGPSTNRHMTIYLRHTFVLTNAPLWTNLSLRVLRDDGAVIYLNGMEVFRNNMPGNAIGYSTAASTNVGGADETLNFYATNVNAGLLVNGTNVLAAEVHQQNNESSDLSFDAELRGVLRPVLLAQRVTNQLRLVWSAPGTNYTLQASSDVGGQWSSITAPIVFSNGSFSTTLTATGAQRWFRLVR